MDELWIVILAGAAGVGLGVVYFGGLWLTLRRLPHSRTPALLVLGSFFGRTALVLLGLYLLMGAHWERLLAGLAGFLLARVALTRWLRPSDLATERAQR